MASNTPSAPADGPRLGAFLTLTVALLLVFGGISRIGQLRDLSAGLSAPQDDRVAEVRRKLREERERTILVIGSGATGSAADPAPPPHGAVSGAVETAPARTTPERSAPPPPPVTPPAAPADAPSAPHQPERTPAMPRPRPEPEHGSYTVRANDTLYEIAERLYGDGTLWPLIRRANPGIDPRRLHVGTPLRIPFRDAGGRPLVDRTQAVAGGGRPLP
jgi:nucleoid-associated protein YgaU